MTYKILELGNPILRQKTVPVNNINSPETKELIHVLSTTLLEYDGAGLAAPQIGYLSQAFVLDKDFDKPSKKPFHVVINPRILQVAGEIKKRYEGCLSIKGLLVQVPRHEVIEVQYLDESGTEITKKLEGFWARAFQHEYDHLQGILTLDKIESVSDLISEFEYSKLVRSRIK
jgi:peptide deformylase